MSKLRVNAFTLSLDGFGAGPDQTLQNPLGVGFRSAIFCLGTIAIGLGVRSLP